MTSRRNKVLLLLGIPGAVLGLAVAFLLYLGSRDDLWMKPNSNEVHLGNIESQLSLYKVEHGRYPTEEEGLAALHQVQPGWFETPEEYTVDIWGNELHYANPCMSDDPRCVVEFTSYGRDGRPGGKDARDVDLTFQMRKPSAQVIYEEHGEPYHRER